MESFDEAVEEPQEPVVELEPAVSVAERYAVARAAFDAQLERDFPNFSVEEYSAEKAEAEGIDRQTLSTKLLVGVRAVPDRLDISGDGKIGLDDAKIASKMAAERVGKAWGKVTSIDKDDVTQATASVRDKAARTGRRITSFDYAGAAGQTAKKAKGAPRKVNADTFRASRHTAAKLGKTAIGIQGLQNRKEAAEIKRVGDEYIAAAEALTEEQRAELYARIEEFGALRLEALHETLGRFLKILESLKRRNRAKEYELLEGLGIDTATLDSMGKLDMTVTESLTATAATGALGLAAVMGTPALVTATVGALATASTGTAISSLSGAAASNAILAWLGGGSLAAGGGGMAAGGVVLAGITVGATAGVTLLAAGILISTHYGKKLTEARTYQKEVALAAASLENACVVMDGITQRIEELSTVTEELRDRTLPLLDELEALVPVFNGKNEDHAAVFSSCGILVKTMVELAQGPLLGDEGELTDESLSITAHVKKIMNTEV